MKHLFSSLVSVAEQKMVPENGRMVLKWVEVEGLTDLECRLDLQFLRPGRDTPPAIVAGAIPDREGIMFCLMTDKLKAGMQITTKENKKGKEVVKGVFEIKEIPDIALNYSDQHHIEVKIIETNQGTTVNFPDIPDSYELKEIVDPPGGPDD